MKRKRNVKIVVHVFTVPQILWAEDLSDGNFNITSLSEKEGYLRSAPA
jgi:hypothetical protein